ncbi:MAG: glycosyl hydrolase family 8, partial [bacterium]
MSLLKRIVLVSLFLLSIFAAGVVIAAPVWVDYPNGIQLSTGSSMTSDLNTKWTTWKAKFTAVSGSNGTRVVGPESPHNGRTVSEGQGYGLLMAVYMDDKTLFDQLWKYKLYICGLAGGKALMPWKTSNDGTALAGDNNSATDGDTDMAWALIQASRRWGGTPTGQASTYAQYATAMLNNIYSMDRKADNSMGPGDNWDGNEYPSYFSEGFYREFDTFEGGTRWAAVITVCNNHLAADRNTANGLTSETCDHSGARTDNTYSYNACRVPWRYAIDYIWHGNTFADTQIGYQEIFFTNIAASNVGDGYTVSTGAKTGANNNASFIGPAGCAFMGGTNQTKLTEYYNQTAGTFTNACNNNEYYNASLGLLSLLVMSGNFPVTFSAVAPTITPTGLPAGSCLFDDMEDGNAGNNYGGFWYSYMGDAPSTIWP